MSITTLLPCWISLLYVNLNDFADKIDGMRHERGRRLWFDVSEVSAEDSIVGAELRLYQSGNWSQKVKSSSFTVTAYQVVTDKFGLVHVTFLQNMDMI